MLKNFLTKHLFAIFFLSMLAPALNLHGQESPLLKPDVEQVQPGVFLVNDVHVYPGSYVPDADLSDLDLTGIDFSGVNFPNANFQGSNLEDANLSNANLPDANFKSANLKGANLTNAFLVRSDLTECNLKGANITNAYLASADLTECNLKGANITNAYLTSADLTNVNMANSTLIGANVEGANLSESDLLNAKLKGVTSGDIIGSPLNIPMGFKMINGAILGPNASVYTPHDFSDADLSGMDLTGTYLERPNFTGTNLSGVDFTGAWVYRPDFTNADLTEATLKNVVCFTPTFENTTFTGADFSGAEVYAHRGSVSGTNFSKTDLTGVNFSGASLFSANFSGSDLSEVNLSNAKLGPTFDSETSQKIGGGANFQNAKLSNADLSGADLDDIITADIEGLPAALPDGFRLINGYILGPKVRLSSSADLSGGDLAGLNLEYISMPNVDLSGANLTGTKLAGAGIGWASPTPKDSESLPIIGEPSSLPTHWKLREGYLVDVTSPTLRLIGSQELIHQIGTEYTDRGATAIDNEGFAIDVIASGAVDGMMAGVYEIEYTATDDSGNISSIIRTITVPAPPVITLNGPLHVYVNKGATYEEQGATAEDAEDRAVEVTIDGSVDTSIMGVQEITYIAKDRYGNQSSATRYVNVIHPNARFLKFRINNDSVSVVACAKSIRGGLTIPSSWDGKPVTSIGDGAFESCLQLTSVTIGDSVTSIGKQAFYGCRSLTSVTIGDSVNSIGKDAFSFCRSLTSVTIGDSVNSIGKEAFSYCRSLTSVTIPDSVTSIGSYAFYKCTSLKSVTIGNSVTSIGYEAFSYCTSLKSVTIPGSVTSIRTMAFLQCQSLPSITFEGNAPKLGNEVFYGLPRSAKVYVKANATGFGTTFGGKAVVREGSITTASKGNTSDGPIMGAVVFFDVNLNGLPDEGEPQTTSNGWGDYWLDIPLETYDLNDNGVIDISEGVIVSQGGTDTATGLSVKTTLKGPASATVITPLTTLVTRVMEQNPELDASAAANKLEDSLGIPAGIDILSFDTFKEASEENPSAADVLTATAKLQDTLVQGGNLIGGATGKSLQEGSDAVMDAIAQQVKAGNNVDLDSKDSLKGLITEAASTSGANLTEAQTDGAASIMEASSKAKEDAKASASTVTELATEVSRVQAVSQSKAADDLEAVGAQTADLESTVLAYTGAAMQQQVQTEVVGGFNASNREAPVFAFQSASYTVKENGQQQPVIQINRTGDSFEAVELTVTPIASSATAGEDFNGEPVSVNFEPLEIRKTLDLQTLLIDDELVEEPETFSLQLEVVRDPEDPDLPELPDGEEDLFPDRPTVGTIGLTTLTIISDDPQITWSAPEEITYGAKLSEVHLNPTTEVPGRFELSHSQGDVLAVGEHILKVDFYPTDQTTYRAVSLKRTINVNKAALTISVADVSRIISTQNPNFVITYNGFVNNETKANLVSEAVATTTATTSSEPGDYPITLSGAASNNYAITYVSGVLKVSDQQTPQITWVVPSPLNYGAKLSEVHLNPTTEVPGRFELSHSQGDVLAVGEHILKVDFYPTDQTTYRAVSLKRTINVNKAALTISVADVSRIISTQNPNFVITYNGFVNNETKANLVSEAVATTTATTSSEPGDYPITLSGAASNNYAITYVNGVLSVTGKLKPVEVKVFDIMNAPFGFSFNTGVGSKYRVEASDDLTKWNQLSEIDGTGEAVQFIDFRKAYYQQQYYRVKIGE